MENSFLATTMPEGVLGAIARRIPGQVIESSQIAEDGSVQFGYPVFINDDGVAEGINTAGATYNPTDFYGVCYRSFPVRQTDNGKPNPKLQQGILRTGYIWMQVAETDVTEIKYGMPVYVVVKTAGTHKVLGQVVGTADGANTIQINATFMGPKGQNGLVEVAVGI